MVHDNIQKEIDHSCETLVDLYAFPPPCSVDCELTDEVQCQAVEAAETAAMTEPQPGTPIA